MDKVLVTGGAGYVGSHVCALLAERGFVPVVFDDLSNGHADAVQWGPLEIGDIRDRDALNQVFRRHAPAAVLHFAGLIEVGASTREPERFFDINVGGSMALIAAAQRAGVQALVFSSTCAIYGDPVRLPIDEDHPRAPLNPYGRSKLMVEQALSDMARHSRLRSISLRYFNAAGADPAGRIGERHDPETHLIPLAIAAAMDGAPFMILGGDYPTPDGSAVRDYVHVCDLAEAHVRAVQRLLNGKPGGAYNLGTGVGTSVRQILTAVERVGGATVEAVVAARRAGDASVLVADNRRANEELGWSPTFSLDEIIASAWRWRHHHGAAASAANAPSLATIHPAGR